MIQFEHPKNQSSILKVIGIGGGGSNAVNYMYGLNIEGVDFVVCNTDSQALVLSPVPNKVQLGPHLTQGLGAGANPEIGKKASEESMEDIAKILQVNTQMAFITAGMGGGTGTGGAPVIAKICKELGILTVGIVTLPFSLEGRRRMNQAQEGIEKMREYVDTMLVISNDKLRQQFGNLPFAKAFAQADGILATAAKCITDVITTTGMMNVDFSDVRTVMTKGQSAILGNAAVAGENRALHAVEQALNSPLLNDADISGAKWILLTINSSPGEFEHTLDEVEVIMAYVTQQAGDLCDVILGTGYDEKLEDKIGVTLIATGFDYKEVKIEAAIKQKEPTKFTVTLGDKNTSADLENFDVKTTPTTPAAPQINQVIFNNMSMAPTLIEVPSKTEPIFKQDFPKQEVLMPEIRFSVPLQQVEKQNPVNDSTLFPLPLEQQIDEPAMKLVIKEEEKIVEPIQIPTLAPTPIPTMKVRVGDRMLTDEEIEEKKRFEEQKKALEDRAERLRRISFNIKKAESNDEIETVPAFIRKKVQLENQTPSTDNYFSGYSVGLEEDGNNKQSSIQTINTFLYGKKPD